MTSRRQEAPIAQVNSQLEANRVEMEHLTKDANQLKEKIAQYQERINATPMREQQSRGCSGTTNCFSRITPTC